MLKKSQMHRYQKGAVRHGVRHEAAGLLMEMGLGKTVCSLTIVAELMDLFQVSKTLVVGPPNVAKKVWSDEVQEWEHLNHLKVLPVFGTPKKRRELLHEEADIYTLSVHCLSWFCAEFPNPDFDMLIVDESSMFKAHNTNRFRDLKAILPSFARRLILTGTPTPNSLIELWPQLYILDEGERLGKYITHYRNSFFTKGFHQYSKYKPVDGAKQKVHELISDICVSMKAEDYLELPERVRNPIMLDLDDKMRKAYDKFERDYLLSVAEEHGGITHIPAVNAAALVNKLLQFAGGAIYDEEKNIKQLHSIKLDELEERIEVLSGEPVFVAYAYQHERDRILKRLKKYGVKQFSGAKDVDAWNRGEIPVLISHPLSAGHGLNMQKGGRNIIWYSQTWSLEQYLQFNARLHRQGQKQRTFIHELIMRGTIDETVAAARQSKDETQVALMKALRFRAELHGIK